VRISTIKRCYKGRGKKIAYPHQKISGSHRRASPGRNLQKKTSPVAVSPEMRSKRGVARFHPSQSHR